MLVSTYLGPNLVYFTQDVRSSLQPLRCGKRRVRVPRLRQALQLCASDAARAEEGEGRVGANVLAVVPGNEDVCRGHGKI